MEKEFIIMVIMVTFIIGVSATEMFKHYLKMRQLGGGKVLLNKSLCKQETRFQIGRAHV